LSASDEPKLGKVMNKMNVGAQEFFSVQGVDIFGQNLAFSGKQIGVFPRKNWRFSAKKIAFLSNPDVMIKFLQELAAVYAINANFFTKNLFEITASVPFVCIKF
jgi:hypothetical protein